MAKPTPTPGVLEAGTVVNLTFPVRCANAGQVVGVKALRAAVARPTFWTEARRNKLTAFVQELAREAVAEEARRLRGIAKGVLVVLLAAGLAGCASTFVERPVNRLNPAASYTEDVEACEVWALGMPNSMGRSYGSWFRSCLRGRGWVVEVVEVPRG